MSFNGADGLGNALDDPVSIKIDVKAPDPFEVTLTPGWNLVSLPADPQMSAINDVIPADHPITIVLTYDPTQPGAWLSAARGDDGTWGGTLENISARTAYWIFTEAFEALKVPLVRQAGGQVTNLPTVNLVAGWNLIGVLDVSGSASFGDGTESGEYGHLTSGRYVQTYSYNSSNDRFEVLGDSGALVGHGYWTYVSEATVLVP